MKNNKFSVACLALASAAILGSSAKAAAPSPFPNGDVVLGVYDTSGNVASSYEVDLGNITKFIDTKAPLTFTLTADITKLYTLAGTPNSDLTYAVFASAGAFGATTPDGTLLSANEIFVTHAESTLDTVGPAIASPGIQGTQRGDISATTAYFTGKPSNGTTFSGATFLSDASGQPFEIEVNKGAKNFDFGTSSPVRGSLGLSDTDFDEIIQNGTSSVLGTFNFSDGDILTFDPLLEVGAVPEPSTYALCLFGGALLFWTIKRRRNNV